MAIRTASSKGAGVARSNIGTFTIGVGATGSLVDPVDLLTNYQTIIIRCADCTNIANATSLGIQVGYDTADTLVSLADPDTPGTAYAQPVPGSGTFSFLALAATGAQRLRFILSNAAEDGSVVFTVYGFNPSPVG